MATALDEEIKRAEKEGASVSEVLSRLLLEEQAYRQNQSLLYRLKGARIPYDWSLKTFPFEQQPGVNKAQINELAGLAFMERGENIVLVGDTGTGKSGLAIGLLRQALLSGYRGRFYNAQDLLDELYASLADRSSARLMRRLLPLRRLTHRRNWLPYRKTGAGERLLQTDGGALHPQKSDDYHYQFVISRVVRPL
jgi:DNA replication protein DnaC